MGAPITPATFAPCVGQSFSAAPSVQGESLALELASCQESPNARPDSPAFSLIFLAPAAEYLPQQIFSLAHDEVGELDLFLVPLGPQDGRMRYEAVIN